MWIPTARGPRLAAEQWPGRGDAMIVMAHGFCSDRHSRGRFDRLATDFSTLGYDVLTFDFSGCGESDDDVITAEHEVEDLRAVIDFVRGQGYRRVALHGHSLGGSICLQAYDDGIETMLLTGTATDAMHYDWTDFYGAERMAELNETGQLRDGRHVITWETLRAFDQRDQATLLASIKCPVLLVHGGNPDDGEEQELLSRSRKGIALLPPESRLEVIDGAGHSLKNHMTELSALARGWYAKHLPLR
jgi:pimeloyl-ACP methyl ester carboxylesterase